MRTLEDLTGQESGIVIYGKDGILCNWSSIAGLPRLFTSLNTVVGMGEEIPDVEGEHLDDLSSLLSDVSITVCADFSGDLPKSGTVYQIRDDVTVIAPDGWA